MGQKVKIRFWFTLDTSFSPPKPDKANTG